jgi:phosphoribosylformylglycinamidine cyclo-ligase
MTIYKDAGVDISKADRLVEHLKLEGFGAIVELEGVNPTIVMSADGVGTKILVAEAQNKHDTVGIDLVAMCTNDLLCQGARPHSFLDYYATGSISLKKSREIMDGILEGCRLAGCKLIGGETAELPGMFVNHRYDLGGFAMGIMEKLLPKMTQGGVTASVYYAELFL